MNTLLEIRVINTNKFQAILLDKRNSGLHLNENITIDQENKWLSQMLKC